VALRQRSVAGSHPFARLRDWAYTPEPGGRDLRLDFLRGFAIFAMIVDHFGGHSWLTPITGGNEFLVSAAEGFVFLSGFVMGLVYGRRIARLGWVPTAEAILRRAALLYTVTVGLTLLFVALFAFTDLRLWFDREYGLGLTDPVELVVGTLTLHYTYHGTDILWMYTVLIAASPLMFHFLITGRTAGLLLGSILLWLAYQVFPAQAAIPWVAGNVVNFPLAAWQLYFVMGLTMGCHRDALARQLGRIPRWPALAVSALGFLGLVLLDWGHETGRLATWPLLKGLAGETYQQVFDKPSVSWGRVLAFAIAASFMLLLVTQFWQPLRRLLGWLLLPLGQAALLAYGLHLIVIVAVYNADVWELYEQSRAANTLLQAITVGLVWGLVKWWDLLGTLPRRLGELLEAPLRQPTQARLRLAAASLLLVGLTAATAILVGPVRASRQAASAEAAAEAAGTLVYAPDDEPAQDPARVLLVLRPETSSGPVAATPMLDNARRAGWVVVAPTLDYGEWSNEDDVRAAALHLLPDLRALLEDLDAHLEQPTLPRAFVYGVGRGGQLANLFALAHPELVRAVAVTGALPCMLPLEQSGPPGAQTPLYFPTGLADLEVYTGDPPNFAALREISFMIQPQAARPSRGTQGCGWLGYPLDPAEHLDTYASLLRDLGAEVQIVSNDDEPTRPGRRALSFFEQLPTQ
jgi:hypothetical protein